VEALETRRCGPTLEHAMLKSALLSLVIAALILPTAVILGGVDSERVGVVDGVVGIAWVVVDQVCGCAPRRARTAS